MNWYGEDYGRGRFWGNSDHGLDVLSVGYYLRSSGDVQRVDEYMSQEFTGKVWYRDTHLEREREIIIFKRVSGVCFNQVW